jgi:hypothetical protein
MKLLVLWCLVFFSALLASQEYGDTLYVAAKNGLIIRDSPTSDASVIGALEYGECVVYNGTGVYDTIDIRIAEWVKVYFPNNKYGFVYGGYLNSIDPPKDSYVSIRNYMEVFSSKFPSIIREEYLEDKPGDKYDRITNINIGNNHAFKFWCEYEYCHYEYIFEKVSINEILNLIELAEFEGLNLEYNLLKASRTNDLSIFIYTHALNDPPEDIFVIQKIYPAGVRVVIKG